MRKNFVDLLRETVSYSRGSKLLPAGQIWPAKLFHPAANAL